MNELLDRTLLQHARALEEGEYSSRELTAAFLERIKEKDATTGAFLSVDREGAMKAAEASDGRRKRGEARGLLDGIPYSLKDNICAKGLPLTCGSRILEDYLSPYDATVTVRLRQAGAVLLGKNNMDEFAMGSATEYSALGVTVNPHDPERVPGGSSGGSAAAVAAGESVFSLGTDTGGSVRQPAAFCGVYGLKPTYGVLSRYGVASMATSLDCVGLLAKSAMDCTALLGALSGKDPRDATSKDYSREALFYQAESGLKGLRIALVGNFYETATDAEILDGVGEAARCFGDGGAVIETVRLPLPKQALAAYTVLSSAEASSNLSRYDGVRFGRRSSEAQTLGALYSDSRSEGFGSEVKRRILFGTDMLLNENRSFYYVRAQRVREMVRHEMGELLRRYDLILTPTTTTPAFKRGDRPSPTELYYADLCTVYANLSGFPALSIPFGKNKEGLPLAVQLTARPMEEGLLVGVARFLEEERHEYF